MKRILAILLATVAVVCGQEINGGKTFINGELVTAAKLNLMLSGATINATFYTDKSSATIDGADSILFYDVTAAGLRRTTFGAAVLNNTALVTGQPLTTPALDDTIFGYDTSGVSLAQFQISTLLALQSLSNTNLSNTVAIASDPLRIIFPVYLGGDFSGSIGLSGGTNYNVSLSNLFSLFPYTKPFTNLPSFTGQPTNTDRFWYWDSVAGLNKQVSPAALITNAPAPVSFSNSMVFMAVDTNSGNIYRLTMGQLTNFVQFIFPSLTNNRVAFTTSQYPLPASGLVASTNHGLGHTPNFVSWVLVCTNTDLGFTNGDEVAVDGYNNNSAGVVFSAGANATNVFLYYSGNGPKIASKVDGSENAITASRWNIRGYAAYITQ